MQQSLDNVMGDIFFDPNGILAGGQVRFAHVTPGALVTNADFLVI